MEKKKTKNLKQIMSTEGKLFVDGKKEDKESETNYDLFTRSWTLSDETEVRSVEFEDGCF